MAPRPSPRRSPKWDACTGNCAMVFLPPIRVLCRKPWGRGLWLVVTRRLGRRQPRHWLGWGRQSTWARAVGMGRWWLNRLGTAWQKCAPRPRHHPVWGGRWHLPKHSGIGWWWYHWLLHPVRHQCVRSMPWDGHRHLPRHINVGRWCFCGFLHPAWRNLRDALCVGRWHLPRHIRRAACWWAPYRPELLWWWHLPKAWCNWWRRLHRDIPGTSCCN